MKNYRIFYLLLLLTFPFRPLFAQVYLSEGFNGFSIPAGWEVQNQGSGPCFWTIGTPDDHTMLGSNFLYVNSNNGFGTVANEIITSPVINAVAAGVVKLRFRHHYRDDPNSPNDAGFAEAFNGTSWISMNTYTTTIGQENNPALAEIDLTPYLNPNLRIRFRYIGQFSYYWLIDDLKVYAAPAADLGVSAIRNVETSCALGIPANLSVTIRNYGTQTQSNFPVSFRAANLPAFTEVFSGSLAPGDSVNHTFSIPFNSALPGKIRFKSWTSLSGDGEPGNDTSFASNFVLLPGLNQLEFTGYDGGNLEQTNPGWEEGYGENNPQLPNSSWTRSAPAQELALGSRTCRINLYTTLVRAWLISPPFQAKSGDFLRFKVAVTEYLNGGTATMGSDDAVVVRATTNCGQSWIDLQAFTAASGIGNQLENKAVSLSQFSGQTVRIAFFGTDGFTDDLNDYDFHLDDVRVSQIFPADVNLAELILPPGKCGLPNGFPVKIKVVNNGSATQSSIPASYQVPGLPLVSQNFPVSLAPGADTILQFASLVSVPNPGNYTISAWTELADDGNLQDDTVKLKPFFRVKSGFPLQNFTGFLGSGLGNQWEEANDLNAIGQTSSWTEADPSQIAAFGTETARVSLYSNFTKSWILSPPFKPGVDVNLRFKIALTAGMGAQSSALGSDDSLIVRITTDCGQTWQNLRHFTAASSLSNQLQVQNISLAAFEGQTVRIGFYATDGAVDDINDSDVHLDDIELTSNSAIDMDLTEIIIPTGNCGVEAQFPVKVKILNTGTQTQTNIPLFYQVTGQPFVTQIFPVSLPPSADTIVEFSLPASVPLPGNFSISAWVSQPGDNNPAGDSILAIPFYRASQGFNFQNFTGYNGVNLANGWEEKRGSADLLQPGSQWTSAQAAQIDSLGSETARINLYTILRKEWMISPAFRPETGKVLRFKIAVTNSFSTEPDSMGSDDSLIVKVTTDCGQTWQNIKSITKVNYPENQLEVQSVSLAAFTNQTLRIAFYATDGLVDDEQDYDVHIDDIELIDVSPNDLGITAFLLPPLNCGLPPSLPVKVKVGNLGTLPQFGFSVSYSLNGGPAQTEPFPGTLNPLQEQEFEFSVPAALSLTGSNVIKAWTNFPSDQNLSNDSLVSPFLLPPNAGINLLNFDDYDGNNLSLLNPGWEEKSGAVPSGNSSFWVASNEGQTNAFGTTTARVALSGNSRREWIISPIFKPLPESEIRFSLALTDRNFSISDFMGSDDSLKLMISTDCGENWSLVRAFTALNGLSNSLTPFSANISSYAGQNCRIAFQATDGNINNPEDYELHLDSIRTGPLTVSVSSILQTQEINLYPNPCSGDRLFIRMSGNDKEVPRFYSATGKEYFPSAIPGEKGVYNVEAMPSGYYLLRWKNQTKSLVLVR